MLRVKVIRAVVFVVLCMILVDMSERHVIELLTMLEDEGWTHRVAAAGERRPEPYRVGDQKIWLLSQRSNSFNALYFECLLKASF